MDWSNDGSTGQEGRYETTMSQPISSWAPPVVARLTQD